MADWNFINDCLKKRKETKAHDHSDKLLPLLKKKKKNPTNFKTYTHRLLLVERNLCKGLMLNPWL